MAADQAWCAANNAIWRHEGKKEVRCPTIFTEEFGSAQQRDFLRVFCANNPLRYYGEAVLALENEIKRRQGIPTGAEIAIELGKQLRLGD